LIISFISFVRFVGLDWIILIVYLFLATQSRSDVQAATGVLVVAKDVYHMTVDISWYEKLQKWRMVWHRVALGCDLDLVLIWVLVLGLDLDLVLE
jgi:hypothetical protein